MKLRGLFSEKTINNKRSGPRVAIYLRAVSTVKNQYRSYQLSRPAKSKKRFILYITILILFCTAMFYAGFVVKEVSVIDINNSNLYSSAVGDIRDKFLGSNTFLVTEIDIDQYITTSIPDYQFEKLEKIYPWQIKVYVVRREKKYIINANNGVFELDKNFVVIANAPSDINANVKYLHEIWIGEQIKDPLLEAGVKYGEIDVNVVIDSTSITTKFDDDTLVLLPSNNMQKTDELVELLKKIIQKYRIENRKVKVIDLRFSKPLIQFE